MPSSHHYSDGSAGFVRFKQSDGVHTHIQRLHLRFATIDNVTDPGSPADGDHLINPEGDVNATIRNYFALVRDIIASTYSLSVIDFVPVSGGVPVGPPVPLQPYTIAGENTDTGIPEAQSTMTFRDTDGAPASIRWFGSVPSWTPQTKPPVVPNWAGGALAQLAAYLLGIARTGGTTYPAGLTHIVSHHGLPFAVPLSQVYGLNNRLRREYRVK